MSAPLVLSNSLEHLQQKKFNGYFFITEIHKSKISTHLQNNLTK